MLELTKEIIDKVKYEAGIEVKRVMSNDLVEVVLYGSCARGDYKADSDIDIALITRCDRKTAKKYEDDLAGIATQLAMKYFAVVNFVCIPQDEYEEKKAWYSYFNNILNEGESLYGERIL